MTAGLDSLKTRRSLKVGASTYDYFSLHAAEKAGLGDLSRLPVSLKVLLENLLRYEDGRTVTVDDIKAMAAWLRDRRSDREIAYRPARVLMQDFTGVPAVVDLAAMRDAMLKLGGDPKKINPLSPVDLVIDHSVMVDYFGGTGAFAKNVAHGVRAQRRALRLPALGPDAPSTISASCRRAPASATRSISSTWRRWSGAPTSRTSRQEAHGRLSRHAGRHRQPHHHGQRPGRARLGRRRHRGRGGHARPADLHADPGSGRLQADRQALREGTTATDLVLTVTQMLRKKGVVNKFVEFYGPGLDALSLADRATIANMAPEYGATCGFFPIDAETLRYLKATGRTAARVALVEAYAKAQGLWRTPRRPIRSSPTRSSSTSPPSSPGSPGRSGRRIACRCRRRRWSFGEALTGRLRRRRCRQARAGRRRQLQLGHGDVVIAAITSCTNTSNPSVMLGAGLLARNAVKRGLKAKPWVKTSLAPGSQVVTDYLDQGRPAEGSRQDRLQPRRLWLHHLHRQFRPAARADRGRRDVGRPGRRRGALRQPQLRGPRQSACERQLPRLAAAGRRLCARRLDEGRSDARRRSAPTRTASRSISGTSGPRARRSPTPSARA